MAVTGPAAVDAGAHLATVLQSSDSGDDPFLILVAGFVIGLFLIYYGARLYRIARLVKNTPTATVRSMAVGRAELEGVVRVAGRTLQAPFSDDECVYVDWRIQEYRYDPNDEEHEWDTIASGESSVPFHLEDDTGRVLIQADSDDPSFDISGAFESTVEVGGSERPPDRIAQFIAAGEEGGGGFDVSEFLTNPWESAKDGLFSGGDGAVGHSNNRRRYTQEILPVGTDVYVFGSAEPRDLGEGADATEQALAVGRDPSTDVFLISDRSEDALAKHYTWKGPASVVGGLALSAVALYFLLDWYLLV